MLHCPQKDEATEDRSTVAPISHRQSRELCQSPLVQRHEFLPYRHTRSEDHREKGMIAMLTKLCFGSCAFGAPPPLSLPGQLIA